MFLVISLSTEYALVHWQKMGNFHLKFRPFFSLTSWQIYKPFLCCIQGIMILNTEKPTGDLIHYFSAEQLSQGFQNCLFCTVGDLSAEPSEYQFSNFIPTLDCFGILTPVISSYPFIYSVQSSLYFRYDSVQDWEKYTRITSLCNMIISQLKLFS